MANGEHEDSIIRGIRETEPLKRSPGPGWSVKTAREFQNPFDRTCTYGRLEF